MASDPTVPLNYYAAYAQVNFLQRLFIINIQLNLNSLSGNYGPAIKKQAEALIDAQAIDFVGTDCHRIEHLMILEQSMDSKYYKKLGQIPLKNTII
jgi:tyrosine-protein phosphatase YwqE